MLALDVAVGGVERGEWAGRGAGTASGHWRTGTVALFSVGDARAEKSNVVDDSSGDTTGGGRCEYCGSAGNVKWWWLRGEP